MISVVGESSFQSGSGVTTTGHMTLPGGVAVGDLMIAVMGFEGVASGSGPWAEYDTTGLHPDGEPDNRPAGWVRVLYQAPSATGSGLEVWAGYFGAGTDAHFKFAVSESFASRMLVLRGVLNGDLYASSNPVTTGAIRATAQAQVTGDNPAAPSVSAFQNEMIVAAAAHKLNSPGFGTPTPAGWSSLFDGARAATFGNVEVTAAEATAAVSGDTGSIPWAATTTSSPKGATATLAIQPIPLPTGPGSAPLSFRFKPA